MPISNWKHFGHGVVYIELSGTIDEEDHRKLAEVLADMAAETALTHLIIDKRALDFEAESETAQQSARDAAKVMHDSGVKEVVFIAPPDHPGLEPFRSAFRRLGHAVAVVPGLKEAISETGASHSGTTGYEL